MPKAKVTYYIPMRDEAWDWTAYAKITERQDTVILVLTNKGKRIFDKAISSMPLSEFKRFYDSKQCTYKEAINRLRRLNRA